MFIAVHVCALRNVFLSRPPPLSPSGPERRPNIVRASNRSIDLPQSLQAAERACIDRPLSLSLSRWSCGPELLSRCGNWTGVCTSLTPWASLHSYKQYMVHGRDTTAKRRCRGTGPWSLCRCCAIVESVRPASRTQ
jgi:hypothetical protein